MSWKTIPIKKGYRDVDPFVRIAKDGYLMMNTAAFRCLSTDHDSTHIRFAIRKNESTKCLYACTAHRHDEHNVQMSKTSKKVMAKALIEYLEEHYPGVEKFHLERKPIKLTSGQKAYMLTPAKKTV